MFDQSKTQTAAGYFNEIVGLRIYLALWVAIGHGLQLAGFLKPSNILTKFFLNDGAAVVIFMIISGFVITGLLLKKQESFPRYILRRFFRLYPAYLIALVLGYLALEPWTDIVRNVQYRGEPGWAAYVASNAELRHEVIAHFWQHAFLHATMLHGIIPAQILPRAGMTFLPAAWSISLEWQYYLIAPFIMLMIRTPWKMVLISAAALAGWIFYTRGHLGSYSIGSNLAGATPFFAIGIASRLAYPWLSRVSINPIMPAAGAIFLSVTTLADPLPIAIWATFLSLSLWRSRRSAMSAAFEVAFMSRPALLLGEASYSLYLLHRPVQVFLGDLVMHHLALDRIEMFIVQLIGIAIAMALSICSYFAIERPGIRFGGKLANRLPGQTVKPEPEPEPVFP